MLFAAERPIAYLIGHVTRRRLSYETPGYDPDLALHSPGLLLLLRIVEQLIASREADVLDFGQGDADYKQRFATRSYLEVSALLVQPTAYARSMANLYRGIACASRLGGRVLERHRVKSRVRSWLRRRRAIKPASE